MLSVGSINSAWRNNLSKIVLLSKLSIHLLFLIKSRLSCLYDILIYTVERGISGDTSCEILSCTLLLEFFNLGPKLIWNLCLSIKTLNSHGKIHLFKEVVQLVIASLNFIKLVRYNSLQ